MTSLHHPAFADPQVLVSVHDLREEICAGLGAARVAVRTLDGVSLIVHAGEFVVVRGGVASGATSLLAAVAGRRWFASGMCHVAPALQIRRGAITAAAFHAMRSAWIDHTPRVVSSQSRPLLRSLTLYLFRVRRECPDAAHTVPVDVGRWQAWARALRAGGCSVLVHLPVEIHELRNLSERSFASPEKHTPAVCEHTTGEHTSYMWSGVRELTIDAGRIVSAVPATRPASSGSSNGS